MPFTSHLDLWWTPMSRCGEHDVSVVVYNGCSTSQHGKRAALIRWHALVEHAERSLVRRAVDQMCEGQGLQFTGPI